jgi:hypothetical protein
VAPDPQLAAVLEELAAALRAPGTGAGLGTLTALRAAVTGLDLAELDLIGGARDGGATWQQIAAAMGIRTRTGAQKRHADLSRRYRAVRQEQAPQPVSGEAGHARDGTGVPPDTAVAVPAVQPAAPEQVPDPATADESTLPAASRPVPALGAGWAITQPSGPGGNVVLWREGVRAGTAGRDGLTRSWTARRDSGSIVTTPQARSGRYPTRIKALRALAGEFESGRRRAVTASRVPLPGTGWPGWFLTQTLSDKDERSWQVTAPDGERAGTVRPSWHGARTWTAITGDPAAVFYTPSHIPSAPGEPGAAPGGEWRTRDAAARAIAAGHAQRTPPQDKPA